MKSSLLFAIVCILILAECTQKKEQKEFSFKKKEEVPTKKIEAEPASTRIELSKKGVGPIKFVSLGELNAEQAKEGQGIFESRCTTCHKIGEKFIGPAPNGILKRRSPEWVMNMILNPERMLKEDELAKELFMEFDGSPMSNQGLTEDEARAVLEFFRTLD